MKVLLAVSQCIQYFQACVPECDMNLSQVYSIYSIYICLIGKNESRHLSY